MMRPSATAPVSFTMCFSSLPLDNPLVRVGETCAVSPSSRAIPPMRSAWYGSLTKITSERPRSRKMRAAAARDSHEFVPCTSRRILSSGTPRCRR